jgi:nicotinamidase-related amidase
MHGVVLLVIDMQNDMFVLNERGSQVERLILTISKLIRWARSQTIPIIYTRVAFRPSYVDGLPHAPQIKERHLLCETSQGSEIIAELKPTSDDIVVIKRRTSVFYGTDLDVLLRALGTRTLLFTGFSTARAIESTVREAHNRDLHCVVASDGCWAKTQELHENALKSMADWFARVMTAKEIEEQFTSESPASAKLRGSEH